MAAESGLVLAVENLYQQFSKYPLRTPVASCPCCITPEENRVLATVPLRQLSAEQIQRYAFKAMTTWGDAADFRHFLPRILEFKAQEELWTDFFVLRGKLEMAGYVHWPEPEQRAVRNVLLEWTTWQWHHSSYDVADIGELLQFLGGLEPILARWTVNVADLPSFESFAHFASYTLPELNEGRSSVVKQGFTPDIVAQLNDWFRQRLPLLEAGFFYWTDTQPYLAQLASQGYDFVGSL